MTPALGEQRQQIDKRTPGADDTHLARHDLSDDFRLLGVNGGAGLQKASQALPEAGEVIVPGMPQEVAGGHDADQTTRRIDDRQGLDSSIAHQSPGFFKRHGVVSRHHQFRHHVVAAQVAKPPLVGMSLRLLQQTRSDPCG